jgi:hypothetical protein
MEPEQAETVAVGGAHLRIGSHGKEGVDGSSPSEGFFWITKPLQDPAFVLPRWTLWSTAFARRNGRRVEAARPYPFRLNVTVPATPVTVPVKTSTSWKVALPPACKMSVPLIVEVPTKLPRQPGRPCHRQRKPCLRSAHMDAQP